MDDTERFGLIAIDGTRGEHEIVHQYGPDESWDINTFSDWIKENPEIPQTIAGFLEGHITNEVIGLFDIIFNRNFADVIYGSGGDNGVIFFGRLYAVDSDIYMNACVQCSDCIGFEEMDDEELSAAYDMIWKDLESDSRYVSIEKVMQVYMPLLEDDIIDILSI